MTAGKRETGILQIMAVRMNSLTLELCNVAAEIDLIGAIRAIEHQRLTDLCEAKKRWRKKDRFKKTDKGYRENLYYYSIPHFHYF